MVVVGTHTHILRKFYPILCYVDFIYTIPTILLSNSMLLGAVFHNSHIHLRVGVSLGFQFIKHFKLFNKKIIYNVVVYCLVFCLKNIIFSCVLSGKHCVFLWCKRYFNTTSCVHSLIITQHLVLSYVSCVSGVFSCVSLASLVVCLCFVWCLVSSLVVCFVLLIIFTYNIIKDLPIFKCKMGLLETSIYVPYIPTIVPI